MAYKRLYIFSTHTVSVHKKAFLNVILFLLYTFELFMFRQATLILFKFDLILNSSVHLDTLSFAMPFWKVVILKKKKCINRIYTEQLRRIFHVILLVFDKGNTCVSGPKSVSINISNLNSYQLTGWSFLMFFPFMFSG